MKLPRPGRDILSYATQEQYNNWLAAEAKRVLTAAYKDVVTELTRKYGSLSSFQRQRLASIAEDIRQRLGAGYDALKTWHAKQMADFAMVQSEIAVAELGSLIGSTAGLQFIPPSLAASIAALPIEGLSLGEWWDKAAAEMSDATRRQIQIGLLRGETMDQIVRRIVPKAGTLEPSELRRAVVRARTLIRTTTTAVQNHAHLATFQAQGKNITEYFEFSATLDVRTSSICRSADGRRFKHDDPRALIPPLHPNCRSTIIPILNMRGLSKDVRERAIKVGVGKDGTPPSLPGSYRSYEEWLRAQSPGIQDQILGRGRGQLFRERNIPLKVMITSDQRPLTLEELKAVRLGVI